MKLLSKRKRGKFWRQYRKQAGRCWMCGDLVPPEEMTRDHVVPRVEGGSPDWDNIRLACTFCNTKKSRREGRIMETIINPMLTFEF